jgi:hypothetical protein
MKFIERLREVLKPKSIKGREWQVIGETKVRDMAKFWDLNADTINLISANGLYEWISSTNFTPEQLIAFKEGLAVIPTFLEGCDNRIKEELKQRELKNSLKIN